MSDPHTDISRLLARTAHKKPTETLQNWQLRPRHDTCTQTVLTAHRPATPLSYHVTKLGLRLTSGLVSCILHNDATTTLSKFLLFLLFLWRLQWCSCLCITRSSSKTNVYLIGGNRLLSTHIAIISLHSSTWDRFTLIHLLFPNRSRTM